MASQINRLEARLSDVLIKNTPRLPNDSQKTLVEWAPIISVGMGASTLLAAWSLWHWARLADTTLYYAGTLCAVYTGYTCPLPASRFTVWLWLSLALLTLESLLYLFAYPKLKARKKEGWDYLNYGVVTNIAYLIASLFTSYDTIFYFISALASSSLGLYLIFQVREFYLSAKRIAPSKLTEKDTL